MSTMEHPNVGLIRRMHEALTKGDYLPTLTQIFHEDVVWHLPGRHPLSGDHRGRDAIFAAMRRFEELGKGTFRTKLHDIVGNDEHVVALIRAVGRRQGRTYDAREVDIYHVRDGRVAEFWSFSEDQRLTDEFWS